MNNLSIYKAVLVIHITRLHPAIKTWSLNRKAQEDKEFFGLLLSS